MHRPHSSNFNFMKCQSFQCVQFLIIAASITTSERPGSGTIELSNRFLISSSMNRHDSFDLIHSLGDYKSSKNAFINRLMVDMFSFHHVERSHSTFEVRMWLKNHNWKPQKNLNFRYNYTFTCN